MSEKAKSEKRLQVKYEGVLKVFDIPCYVLDDGTRVLSGRGMQEALRVRDKPEEGKKRGGYILPTFFNSNAFKPLIDNDLQVAKIEPIICYKGNLQIHGYEATVLADICDVVLEARKRGIKLTERQQLVADQCEILVRAFARIGIIALVDEATGYQYEREKDELQQILKAYISEELLPWQKMFPDEFYKEIFRLNGWDYTVKGIQQRPGVIGTWTKRLIYEPMPPEVLKTLVLKTPKTASGKLSSKLHQSLTPDVGRKHLEKQLVSVITLMNISSDWQNFLRYFNKKFGQQEIFENYELIEPNKKIETKINTKPVEDFDQALKGLLSVPPPRKDQKEEETES